MPPTNCSGLSRPHNELTLLLAGVDVDPALGDDAKLDRNRMVELDSQAAGQVLGFVNVATTDQDHFNHPTIEVNLHDLQSRSPVLGVRACVLGERRCRARSGWSMMPTRLVRKSRNAPAASEN